MTPESGAPPTEERRKSYHSFQSNAGGPCALPLLFLSPLLFPPCGGELESKLPRPLSSSMPASAMIEAQVPTFSLEPWASRRRPEGGVIWFEVHQIEKKERRQREKERKKMEIGKAEKKENENSGAKKKNFLFPSLLSSLPSLLSLFSSLSLFLTLHRVQHHRGRRGHHVPRPPLRLGGQLSRLPPGITRKQAEGPRRGAPGRDQRVGRGEAPRVDAADDLVGPLEARGT